MFKRVVLMVLDSVGVGAAPDAHAFSDEGCNTLGHIIETTHVKLPNLWNMGLGNILSNEQSLQNRNANASYGVAIPRGAGKDTTTGHWEMMGVVLNNPLPVYPNGFPHEIISEFERQIDSKILGNIPASGTVIIKELGQQHIATGYPIVYTSSDSVFQIAAHEGVVPVSKLYEYCEIAREILQGPHAVGRVIARPFTGEFPDYERTANRKDFSLKPPSPTVLNQLEESNVPVYAVGKINDIFAGSGITYHVGSHSNMEGVKRTLQLIDEKPSGLIFTNLVDFDMLYGHRRNPKGYGQALQDFDERVPEILASLDDDDCLVLTADHGNDPTYRGSDHTRENVPLLVYSKNCKSVNIGQVALSDIGATVADNFGVQPATGTSFLSLLSQER